MDRKDLKNKKYDLFFIIILMMAFFSFLLDPFVRNFAITIQNYYITIILRLLTHSASIFILLILLPSVFLYFKDKKDMILALLVSFFGSSIVSFLIKMIMSRPRPFGVVTFPSSFYNLYSFPSTHATMAFSAIPILLVIYYKRRYLLFSYASIIAISRVYFGVHFLSDVIFGAIIGYIFGMFVLILKKLYIKFNPNMYDKLEARRQVVHIILGLLLVALVHYDLINPLNLTIAITFTALGFSISKKYNVKLVTWILKKFERKRHLNRFPGKGLIFYLMGVLAAITFFPKDIAMASIMILAIADPVSHIVGHYGRMKSPFSEKKYLEGFIAGTVIGFIMASFYVAPFEAFLATITAMFAESLDIKLFKFKIDDNFVIPVVAGTTVWILRFVS